MIQENTGVFWLFRLDVSSVSFEMAYSTFIIDFYCTQFHGYAYLLSVKLSINSNSSIVLKMLVFIPTKQVTVCINNLRSPYIAHTAISRNNIGT